MTALDDSSTGLDVIWLRYSKSKKYCLYPIHLLCCFQNFCRIAMGGSHIGHQNAAILQRQLICAGNGCTIWTRDERRRIPNAIKSWRKKTARRIRKQQSERDLRPVRLGASHSLRCHSNKISVMSHQKVPAPQLCHAVRYSVLQLCEKFLRCVVMTNKETIVHRYPSLFMGNIAYHVLSLL